MRFLAFLLFLSPAALADDSTVRAAAAMPYGIGGPMDLPIEMPSCTTTGVEVPDKYLELLGKLNEPVSTPTRTEYPHSEPAHGLTVVHGGAINPLGISNENGVKVYRGPGK